MKVSAGMPTGVAALFFDSVAKRRRLEGRWVDDLESRGFSEVVLPVVDYLDPYEQIPGVDRNELYRFVDRDGEVLALRADFTPALARLLAPRLQNLQLPLRLFYRGDVLRYQEERAGRMRELYQLGGEILGCGDDGELEALRCTLELLALSRHRDLVVIVGFAGALDAFHGPADDSADLRGMVELTEAFHRRERRFVRRLGVEACEVLENGEPSDSSVLGARAAARLEWLRGQVEVLSHEFPKVDLRIDLAEFAGQTMIPKLREALGHSAYYDGLVFRGYRGATAEPVAVGGRYDHLFRQLGAEVSAAGFSLGVDRLACGEGDAE